MKIVIALHELPQTQPGGVGLFSQRLAGELTRRGHRVTLLAGGERRRERATLARQDDACDGVPTWRLSRGPQSRAGALVDSVVNPAVDRLLARFFAEQRPEVVHLQHPLSLSARVTSLAQGAGAAVVASVHDYWPICQRLDLRRPEGSLCPGPAGGVRCARCHPRERRKTALDGLVRRNRARLRDLGQDAARLGPYVARTQLVQGCYAQAERITVPSRFVADLLQQHGFDGANMALVDYGIERLPPGVDTAPRPKNPFVFGYLGTMGPHKGLHVLLRALRQMPLSPGWRLQVHGGPLRDPHLRQQLTRAERRGDLTYRGPYQAEHLPGILAELDALVIPSLWQETGPMVWMEAVAAGLPVVASRLGGLKERVRHDKDGLLVAAGDPHQLADAMQRIINNYNKFRNNTLQRDVRTVAQAAAEFEQVYHEANTKNS